MKTALSAIFRRISGNRLYSGLTRKQRKDEARYTQRIETEPGSVFQEPPVNLTGGWLAGCFDIKNQGELDKMVRGTSSSPAEIFKEAIAGYSSSNPSDWALCAPEGVVVRANPRGLEIAKVARQHGSIVTVLP